MCDCVHVCVCVCVCVCICTCSLCMCADGDGRVCVLEVGGGERETCTRQMDTDNNIVVIFPGLRHLQYLITSKHSGVI